MLFSSYVEITQGALLSDLRFISRAVSDDETRYFMNFILIEPVDETPAAKLRIVSTDGRRLHMVELDRNVEKLGLTAGTWIVAQSTTKAVKLARVADGEDVGQYPNYKKVLPIGEPVKVVKFYGFDIKKPDRTSSDLMYLLYSLPEPTAFDLRFISDLGITVWRVEWYAKNMAVSFKSGNLHAVIMPMNLDAISDRVE